jgi:hypothetical protein
VNKQFVGKHMHFVVHQVFDQLHFQKMHIEHFLEQNQFVHQHLMNYLMHWQEDLDHQHQLIMLDRFDQD